MSFNNSQIIFIFMSFFYKKDFIDYILDSLFLYRNISVKNECEFRFFRQQNDECVMSIKILQYQIQKQEMVYIEWSLLFIYSWQHRKMCLYKQ